MKNPLNAIRGHFSCTLCRAESSVDENPAIVKMREVNEELESRIEERFGRDFLENMIFARERDAEDGDVRRRV